MGKGSALVLKCVFILALTDLWIYSPRIYRFPVEQKMENAKYPRHLWKKKDSGLMVRIEREIAIAEKW